MQRTASWYPSSCSHLQWLCMLTVHAGMYFVNIYAYCKAHCAGFKCSGLEHYNTLYIKQSRQNTAEEHGWVAFVWRTCHADICMFDHQTS